MINNIDKLIYLYTFKFFWISKINNFYHYLVNPVYRLINEFLEKQIRKSKECEISFKSGMKRARVHKTNAILTLQVVTLDIKAKEVKFFHTCLTHF